MPTLTTLALARTHISHLVVGATGTGFSVSYPFLKPSVADAADLLVATVVTTGSFSGLVFELQISPDNGVTWNNVSSWDAHATPSTTFPIAENTLYRFNCTTFTGGTTANVFGSATARVLQVPQELQVLQVLQVPPVQLDLVVGLQDQQELLDQLEQQAQQDLLDQQVQVLQAQPELPVRQDRRVLQDLQAQPERQDLLGLAPSLLLFMLLVLEPMVRFSFMAS